MLEFSNLEKTWILDLDGTLVKHNGYKIDGYDTLLPGVREFFNKIPASDKIIILTARKQEYIEDLKNFLKTNDIRYDYLLSDMPMGERILINDTKPSGLKTAFSINQNRDASFDVKYKINDSL